MEFNAAPFLKLSATTHIPNLFLSLNLILLITAMKRKREISIGKKEKIKYTPKKKKDDR